jgi:hypothetical protein
LIEQAEQDIVADFSFPVTGMQHLVRNRELAWIDLHKSTIAHFARIAEHWQAC